MKDNHLFNVQLTHDEEMPIQLIEGVSTCSVCGCIVDAGETECYDCIEWAIIESMGG